MRCGLFDVFHGDSFLKASEQRVERVEAFGLPRCQCKNAARKKSCKKDEKF
jgi:hypothetical protein